MRHKAAQAHEKVLSVMYCLISHSKPDCSDGGATLFLAGADHGYCEKEKRTRQNNLQSATVSLQVVIGLCKRKETAALKIKAAVSNGRIKLSALRRFFSFAVVQQIKILNYNSLMVAVIGMLQMRFAGAKGARREVNTSNTSISPIDVKGICHAVPQ